MKKELLDKAEARYKREMDKLMTERDDAIKQVATLEERLRQADEISNIKITSAVNEAKMKCLWIFMQRFNTMNSSPASSTSTPSSSSTAPFFGAGTGEFFN